VGVILPIFWAIDPGSARCGLVLYGPGSTLAEDTILEARVVTPLVALDSIERCPGHLVVVEMPDALGLPCSRDLLRTAWWVGLYAQAAAGVAEELTRREIKLALCGSSRANDATIRARLIDLYGPPGTKKSPGRTHGIKGDAWAALAVAATWIQKWRGEG
jgi:hypothetical protein